MRKIFLKHQSDDRLMHLMYRYRDLQCTEFIPLPTKKYEYFFYDLKRRLCDKIGIKHYYYHYRHYLTGPSRKIEDSRFLTHVIKEHEGIPDDVHERRHYKTLRRLYYPEFDFFMEPYINEDVSAVGVADNYVRAYYKTWISKQVSPQLKRMYHGVDYYELKDLLPLLLKQSRAEYTRHMKRSNYHKKRAEKRMKRARK